MSTIVQAPESSQASAVVTKAFIRAGKQLGLSNKQLAKMIDVSEPQISRMSYGDVELSKSKTNQWGASLLLIRIARALRTTVGDISTAKLWLNSYNTVLRGIPLDLMTSYEGLLDVARYLDFQRGQF